MERTFSGRFDQHLEAPAGRLELVVGQRAEGTLLVKIPEGTGSLDVSVRSDSGSSIRILFLREGNAALELRFDADVHRDAMLQAGLLDMQEGGLHLDASIRLKEEGAQTRFYTGELIGREGAKKNAVNIVSEVPHTTGTMHNFAVLHDRAEYEMVAAGKIVKGAHDSQSHQETRVLTLGDGHVTKVLPILYIDENDVKASHAMTVGQPDADQLYYLESRGLSRLQSMSLLSIGYFMPVIGLAGNEELRLQLRQELERKAGLYGHQE